MNMPSSKAVNQRYHAKNRLQRNAQNKAWREANRERNDARGLAWREKNKARVMLYNAKIRAKEKGLECTIVLTDVIIPAECPLLGIPFVTGQRRKPVDGSPTLDRIDNSKGYVPGNVWVISYRANKIKNDANPAELFLIARKLSAKLESV